MLESIVCVPNAWDKKNKNKQNPKQNKTFNVERVPLKTSFWSILENITNADEESVHHEAVGRDIL